MSPAAVPKEAEQEHGAVHTQPKVPAKAGSVSDEQLVLNTIRCLAADLCQQFKGGHPGTVMGAAAIGVALWRYEMRYNPANPDWFARDRFVLSAGHACLLQYLMLHFSGYSAWDLEAVKSYHAPKLHTIAAGHPEIEFPGVEVTTGPLGQGIANAVGLAMAGKQLGAQFNKDGYPIVDGKIWCFTGDGCIQEGVGQEAISLAGHFGLDNLIMIYDNNNVTVDGTIDNCFTDDTSAKLRAQNWEVIDVYNGSNDLDAIVAALDKAKTTRGKPTLVNIRTIIGIGAKNENTGSVHGQALGDEGVVHVKTALGFDPKEKFVIPSKVYEYWSEVKPRGQKFEEEWNTMMGKYAKEYPNDHAEFERRRAGKLAEGWKGRLPSKDKLPTEPTPTRKSSGIAFKAVVPSDNSFIAGSADLLESTFVSWDGMTEFQSPSSGLGDYAGRQVRYGIREHAMVGLGNGLAAYQKGMFIPIMSTFFMFWLYAAPAARMSALQGLRWIGIATHDAIGIGEDGPTHQPIALAHFYRGLPGLNFVRPADAEEAIGAWIFALEDEDHPSLFTLSRQPVPLLEGSDRAGVLRGAYPVYGPSDPNLVLIATGAEVSRAVETAKLLPSSLRTRVVSMPSMEHFDRQSSQYKRSVIPRNALVVGIEAWGSFGWARYAHAGCHMHTFGMSAPQQTLYDYFGFSPENLAKKIGDWAERRKDDWPGVGDFEELLLGQVPDHHSPAPYKVQN